MVSMAEGDQVFNVVALRLGHCRQFVGNGNLVMDLEVKAGIARSFGFCPISATSLAGVAISLEYPLTETLGVEALERIAAIIRVVRSQSILAWTQRGVINVGIDGPTMLISQLPHSATGLRDSPHIVDLLAIHDIPDIRVE